jgi:uncharacterized protein (TIGR03000 family)
MSRATICRFLALLLGLGVFGAGVVAGATRSLIWFYEPAEQERAALAVRLADAERRLAALQQTLQQVADQADAVQKQCAGCLALALDPRLLCGPELPLLQAEIKSDPALARLWKDHLAQAENSFSLALQPKTSDRALLHALRALVRQLRDSPDARDDLDRALALDAGGTDAVVQLLAARTLELAGHRAEAAPLLERAGAGRGGLAALPCEVARRRDRLLYRLTLNRVADEMEGAHEDLLRLLDRAVAAEPAKAAPADRVRLRLAQAGLLNRTADRLQAQGQNREATPLLQQSERSAREAVDAARAAKLEALAQAYYEHGRALELLERYPEALQAYQAALAATDKPAEKTQFQDAATRVKLRTRQGSLLPSRAWLLATVTMTHMADAPKDDPEAELRKIIQQADDSIKQAQGKQDQSADPYLTKGQAQARLKQYDLALETLLQGVAVLQKWPKAPGQPRPERFLEAMAAVQAQRGDTVTRGAALEKDVAALKEQQQVLRKQKEAVEKDLADARKAHEDESARRKAVETALEQANQKLAQEQKETAAARQALADNKELLAGVQKSLRESRDETLAAQKEAINTRLKAAADRKGTEKALLECQEKLSGTQKELAEARQGTEPLRKVLEEERARHERSKKGIGELERELGKPRAEGGVKPHDDQGDSSVEVALNGRARFRVEVPAADADLFVNGELSRPAGTLIREFMTPELKPGLRYSYRLEVRFNRDGKTVKLEKNVPFTANTEQRVSFREEAKKE